LAYERGPRDRGGVDRDLVRPRGEQLPDVVGGAHASTHRDGHECALGGPRDHVEDDPALLVGRRDVEEAELVSALGVVARRDLDRVAGVDQLDEADALHDASVLHVEARDDPSREHHASAATASASPSAKLPAYRARPTMTPSTPSAASAATAR